jgi:uncharacterized protein (TIGR00251 family)
MSKVALKYKKDPNLYATEIKVKLLPKSSANQIVGKEGDRLKVSVTSPPVEGKANAALIQLLSRRLRVARSSLEITGGLRSRLKTIRVRGLSPEEVAFLLEN